MMLTSTVVKLRALRNGWLPRAAGEYGHAAFLSLIREVAPDLSRALHEAGTRQPYTVSPLMGCKRDGRGMRVREDGTYWMRFTMLDPSLYSVFSRYFADNTSPDLSLRLGDVAFAIDEITTAQQPEHWSGYTSFSDLLEKAGMNSIIPLQFHSLTAFSLGEVNGSGPRFGLFPEPTLVFDSLLRHWNQFARELLKEPSEWQRWIGQHVIVRRYRTQSDLWQFEHHPQVGFVGHCAYEVKGNHPEEARLLNALADFAFYAGVGCKTAQGMGQSRRPYN